MPNPCYACNRVSTSDEHIPPKGFFPEGHRENLITVRSCDLHNSNKSGDDEYLRMVISMGIESNPHGFKTIFEKILRSFNYEPKKSKLLRNLSPAVAYGTLTGTFDIDMPRFLKGLELMFVGLHYHHFNEYWRESVQINLSPRSYPYIEERTETRIISRSDTHPNNMARLNVTDTVTSLFTNSERIGDNPEIFYFQAHEFKNGRKIIRLVFYEGIIIDGFFGDYSI